MSAVKVLLAGLMASAVTVAAHAEGANPVFNAFADVCAKPAADLTAVKAAADAKGWGATDVAADDAMAGVIVGESLSRATTIEHTGLVLSAWQGTKGAVKISDCTVRIAKANFVGMKDAAANWLAFPAQDATSKRAIYRFTTGGGVYKALTSAEYDAAAGAGGLEILTVSGDQNGTVLDLLMIKK